MLKIENEFVEQLIEAEDPFPIFWKERIEEIWPPLPDLEDYYSQEKEMMELEYFLVNTYEELYSQLLPKYCTGVVPDLEGELPALFLGHHLKYFPGLGVVGREARIRTGGPLLPRQVRYQAALLPESQI